MPTEVHTITPVPTEEPTITPIVTNLHTLTEWIRINKKWVFSGIGVFVLAGITRFFPFIYNRWKKGQEDSKGHTDDNQEVHGASLRDSIVEANEFIGRDKVTFVQGFITEEVPEDKLPNLELFLFVESERHLKEISLHQPQPEGAVQDHQHLFGMALKNTNKNSLPATGIEIRVEFSWRGDQTINFKPLIGTDTQRRTTPGWKAVRSTIEQKDGFPMPAVLQFSGVEDFRSAYGHPSEWPRFRLTMRRKEIGYLDLDYRITSSKPHTIHTGSLTINLG